MAFTVDEQLVDYELFDSEEAQASPITASAAAAGDRVPPAATADTPTAGVTPPALTSEAVGATSASGLAGDTVGDTPVSPPGGYRFRSSSRHHFRGFL